MISIIEKIRLRSKSDYRDIDTGRKRLESAAGLVPNLHFSTRFSVTKVNECLAEWITPPLSSDNVILYLHGGAYVQGSHRTHRSMVTYLCNKGHFKALVLNYRLAPEHPHPAALEDAIAAYNYLLGEGYAPYKIAIAGDSAGGGLALALLMYLRDHQHPLPAAAVLFCPWTDLKMTGESVSANAKYDPLLSKEALSYMAGMYSNGQDLEHPYISPLYGEPGGLPPVLIQVAAKDPVLDDGIRVHERIHAAAGNAQLVNFQGMFHVWQAFWIFIPQGRTALSQAATFLNEHFHARI